MATPSISWEGRVGGYTFFIFCQLRGGPAGVNEFPVKRTIPRDGMMESRWAQIKHDHIRLGHGAHDFNLGLQRRG